MKKIISTIICLGGILLISTQINAQCDPALVTHYNMGDFPFTSSTGVTVTMGGTNSGVLGPYSPYGCSPATCDANTIRMDPGDATTFTFSAAVDELTIITGVMNTFENGSITSNGATPVLSTNCPVDLTITGNAFHQTGALASPVLTITIPGGATEITVNCFASSTGGGNGVFTIDVLDCIQPACTATTSSTISPIACETYTSPSGNVWTSSNTYVDTIPNSVGCDSLITVNLTINNSTAGTDVQTDCGPFTWIDGNTYTSSNNTATFTIPNSNSCDSVITLDLTITPIDATTALSGITISANNSSATYQWLDCDNGNTPITGETGQTYVATANGNYAVEVTENGCTETSACVAITTVSLEEFVQDKISIHPNPSKGEFQLNYGETKPKHVSVIDLAGKTIAYFNEGAMTDFQITAPAGMYIVKIQYESEVKELKLILQ